MRATMIQGVPKKYPVLFTPFQKTRADEWGVLTKIQCGSTKMAAPMNDVVLQILQKNPSLQLTEDQKKVRTVIEL